MSIFRDRTKYRKLMDDSCPADGDLSALQHCLVEMSAQASGSMKVKAPSGQGVNCYGALLNTPTDGQTAEIRLEGIVELKAYGSFNAGIELSVNDASGRVSASASGDYVHAISREASNAQNHLVSCRMVSPYQKN